MGSYDGTCAVSGLPIASGAPVRFMLLCESPYEKELVCQITDVWFPRTLPLKGEYDSYGSVCNVQEGLQRDVWLEALQYDLHEVGGTRGGPHIKGNEFSGFA